MLPLCRGTQSLRFRTKRNHSPQLCCLAKIFASDCETTASTILPTSNVFGVASIGAAASDPYNNPGCMGKVGDYFPFPSERYCTLVSANFLMTSGARELERRGGCGALKGRFPALGDS